VGSLQLLSTLHNDTTSTRFLVREPGHCVELKAIVLSYYITVTLTSLLINFQPFSSPGIPDTLARKSSGEGAHLSERLFRTRISQEGPATRYQVRAISSQHPSRDAGDTKAHSTLLHPTVCSEGYYQKPGPRPKGRQACVV
jgi:hypothetical protein